MYSGALYTRYYNNTENIGVECVCINIQSTEDESPGRIMCDKETNKNFEKLTEENGNKVGVFDNLGEDFGVDFLDPIRQIHGLQTRKELEHVFFVHQVTCATTEYIISIYIYTYVILFSLRKSRARQGRNGAVRVKKKSSELSADLQEKSGRLPRASTGYALVY